MRELGWQSNELSRRNLEYSRTKNTIYHWPDEGGSEKRHCVEDGGSIGSGKHSSGKPRACTDIGKISWRREKRDQT
jgi:hypothetical protein